MKTDADLALLHDSADFKTLVGELEKKFPPKRELAAAAPKVLRLLRYVTARLG
jgi:hypothetical protein